MSDDLVMKLRCRAPAVQEAVGGANPAYAPTVRLAHRWLGTHLLSNHFAEEAVELLVAAAFTGPSVCPPPGSRVTGSAAAWPEKQSTRGRARYSTTHSGMLSSKSTSGSASPT
eukprot:1152030-Pelagomonas_calceolata.AAC.4